MWKGCGMGVEKVRKRSGRVWNESGKSGKGVEKVWKESEKDV